MLIHVQVKWPDLQGLNEADRRAFTALKEVASQCLRVNPCDRTEACEIQPDLFIVMAENDWNGYACPPYM